MPSRVRLAKHRLREHAYTFIDWLNHTIRRYLFVVLHAFVALAIPYRKPHKHACKFYGGSLPPSVCYLGCFVLRNRKAFVHVTNYIQSKPRSIIANKIKINKISGQKKGTECSNNNEKPPIVASWWGGLFACWYLCVLHIYIRLFMDELLKNKLIDYPAFFKLQEIRVSLRYAFNLKLKHCKGTVGGLGKTR